MITPYLSILRGCPLFLHIDNDSLNAMIRCMGGCIRKYSRKEILLAEGSDSRSVGIVLSGAVQMVQLDYEGNRSIVSDIRTGGLFGESFALAGEGILPLDILAAEACEILWLDCNRILFPCAKSCEHHGQLIRNLMYEVAEENLLYYRKLAVISRRTTRDKLMTYLFQQAKQTRSNSFTIPYNRQELADYLAVDRSGLSVEISRLCREGILLVDKKHVTLLDPVE